MTTLRVEEEEEIIFPTSSTREMSSEEAAAPRSRGAMASRSSTLRASVSFFLFGREKILGKIENDERTTNVGFCVFVFRLPEV